MVTQSAPAPAPAPPNTPAPTFGRWDPNSPGRPRPGTLDRWGFVTTPGLDPEAKQRQQYNDATDQLQNRPFGTWIGDKLKNMIPGFHQVTPDYDLPGTYSSGTYHDAWSPVAAALGLAGMASPFPGTSVGTEFAGQQISDALHANEYTFGGGGWGPTTSGNPTHAAPNEQTAGGPPGPSNGGGNAPGMAAFSGVPGGAPFGPQPTQQATASPVTQPQGMPAFPTRLPNHTVPQGYQSLFPTSLSEEDKALLYGKALMA